MLLFPTINVTELFHMAGLFFCNLTHSAYRAGAKPK